MGAGLSTVVANLQVVVVGVAAWLSSTSGRATVAAPIEFAGVVLISGVGSDAAYGDDPVLGVVYGRLAAVAYAGFLLLIREAGRGLRTPAEIMFDATLSWAVAVAILGAALGELDLEPHWPAHGWLFALALSGQVVG